MKKELSISKNKKKNLFCVLMAILIIALYILVDGFGIISTGYNFIKSGGVGDYSTDLFGSAQNYASSDAVMNDSVITVMVDLYVARLVILVLMLFPIVFVTLRYMINFKHSDDTGLKSLVPYLRVLFGLIFFYYALSIKTAFLHEQFTNFYSFGNWVSFFRIILAFIILGAFVVDWPSLIRSLKSFPSSHPVIYKAVFVFAISLCSCMLVEFQIASKMNMANYLLFYNILYWLILQVFVDVITRNVKVGAFVSLALSFLIGLVNDVVYQFRGNYVMYGDLTVVRTAMEVAGNYTYKPSFWLWISVAILVISVAVTIILKFPKHEKPHIKEIAIRAGIEVVLVAGVLFTFSNGMLYRHVFGVGWDYNKNVYHTGYLPYFLSNMNSIKKVTLDGYSAEQADAALEKMSDTKASYSSPNIIIIQNEAFSDLSVAYDIKTNQDYMPFIHSLTENTRKGYLNMSVTGGPTANTEFEILLRSSLQFLPYGSVPYTQYVNADLPSVPMVLKNQPNPYHTVAYHPYYTSGYRRAEVYSHFGFDETVFEDEFKTKRPSEEVLRDYLTDAADYRTVETMYEEWRKKSDAPWFCFNVTIQNHGGYTQKFTPSESDKVYVTNFAATDSINGYLSLIKLSDNAFKELVEYFSKCKEPTIIAMYGDHQPSFDDDANEVLKDHSKGSVYNYYVPYVIWANFDIQEEDTTGRLNTLSTNYFASTVFNVAGIKLTDYDRYLLDLHERIPALTALGAWDKEGSHYTSPKTSPYADSIATLEMIQYNLIFDDAKRLRKRFE